MTMLTGLWSAGLALLLTAALIQVGSTWLTFGNQGLTGASLSHGEGRKHKGVEQNSTMTTWYYSPEPNSVSGTRSSLSLLPGDLLSSSLSTTQFLLLRSVPQWGCPVPSTQITPFRPFPQTPVLLPELKSCPKTNLRKERCPVGWLC